MTPQEKKQKSRLCLHPNARLSLSFIHRNAVKRRGWLWERTPSFLDPSRKEAKETANARRSIRRRDRIFFGAPPLLPIPTIRNSRDRRPRRSKKAETSSAPVVLIVRESKRNGERDGVRSVEGGGCFSVRPRYCQPRQSATVGTGVPDGPKKRKPPLRRHPRTKRRERTAQCD